MTDSETPNHSNQVPEDDPSTDTWVHHVIDELEHGDPDPWGDPSTKVWVRHVIDDMVPKMADSTFVMSLCPADDDGDVKFWVELGAAIMMDKPIIAVVMGDRPVPAKLALVVEEVVRCPDGVDASTSTALAAAIDRMVTKLEGEEH